MTSTSHPIRFNRYGHEVSTHCGQNNSYGCGAPLDAPDGHCTNVAFHEARFFKTRDEGETPMTAVESLAQNLVQATQGAIGQNTPVLARHAANWHREASAAVVAVLRELAADGFGTLAVRKALNGLADEVLLNTPALRGFADEAGKGR